MPSTRGIGSKMMRCCSAALSAMDKPHRRRMRAEEALDRIRVRSGRVGGAQCVQELEEPIGGAHREVVDGMCDDVGVDMLGKVKADRDAARSAALRVVVGDRRNSGEIRETDRHRCRSPVQMRRTGQRRPLRRRRKRAGQQDALRMGGSVPGMNAAIGLVEGRDDFPAEGQEPFVCRQGHGSALRYGAPSYHRGDAPQ
jgi:hypothetical protein